MLTCPVTDIAFLNLVASSSRDTAVPSKFQQVPVSGQPRSEALSLRLSWAFTRMLPGVLPFQRIELLPSILSRLNGLKLRVFDKSRSMTGARQRY